MFYFPSQHDGNYRVQVVPTSAHLPQWYSAKSSQAEATVVKLRGDHNKNVNLIFDSAMSTGRSITGSVRTAQGQLLPIGSVEIRAYDAATGAIAAQSVNSAAGEYELKGLQPRTYKVEFHSVSGDLPHWYSGRDSRADATPVTVTATANTVGIDGVLRQRGGMISGTVRGPAGDPVPGISVEAVRVSDSSAFPVVTGADGTYRIANLASGDYLLLFADPTNVFEMQWAPGVTSRDDAESVDVSVDVTSGGHDATLKRPTATISGVVSTSDSRPVPQGLTVWAYDTADDTGRYASEAEVDRDGSFQLTGLKAGGYTLWFWDGGEYLDLKHPATGAINVAVGQTKAGVDTTITRGGVLTGTIRDPQGKPPHAGVYVRAYDATTGKSVSVGGPAPSNGVFAVLPLPAGEYVLEVTDSTGGYERRWYPDSIDRGGAATLVVGTSEVKSGLDMTLIASTIAISGSVKTSDAAPLPGNVLAIAMHGDRPVSTAPVAANGTFTIAGLSASEYTVMVDDLTEAYESAWWGGSAQDATVVDLTDGASRSGLELTLPVLASISGTVTTIDGSPLSNNVIVQAFDAFTGAYAGQAKVPGATGKYSIRGLAGGDYHVHFFEAGGYQDQWFNGKALQVDAAAVTVASGASIAGIDAVLKP